MKTGDRETDRGFESHTRRHFLKEVLILNTVNILEIKGTAIVSWCRIGTDYNSPKLRSFLTNAIVVYFGLLISLGILSLINSEFPYRSILWIAMLYGVITTFMMFRMLTKTRRVSSKLPPAEKFEIDLRKKHLIARAGDITLELFNVNGYEEWSCTDTTIILYGIPNIHLIRALEEGTEKVSLLPAGYRGYSIQIKVSHEDAKSIQDALSCANTPMHAEVNHVPNSLEIG